MLSTALVDCQICLVLLDLRTLFSYSSLAPSEPEVLATLCNLKAFVSSRTVISYIIIIIIIILA